MKHLIQYEIKNRKDSFLFIIYGTVWLFLAWGIMKLFPQHVIAAAQILNRYDWLQALLGIEKAIESITYENIITIACVPLFAVAFYKMMTDTADAVCREEQLGTIFYFMGIPVTKTRILSAKLSASLLILVTETAVWGLLIWRFFFYNVPDHEYFYIVVNKHVRQVMIAFCCVNFMALSTGFLYGCISRKGDSRYFTGNLLSTGILLAIIPNLFQCCLAVLERNRYDTAIFASYAEILTRLGRYNPLYRSCPIVCTDLPLDSTSILIYITLVILSILSGIWIYQRRAL